MSATIEDKVNQLNSNFQQLHNQLLVMQSEILKLTDYVNELQRGMANLVNKPAKVAKKAPAVKKSKGGGNA